jgi:DNA mismatch endonuclease (patch repair protein)
MVANSGVDSTPERLLRSALHRRGRRFRKNVRLAEAGRRSVDIVFRGARLAVFVDGCFWHGCPIHGVRPRTNSAYWSAKLEQNSRRDRAIEAALAGSGWRVLRFWEHDEVETAADRVEEALDEKNSVARDARIAGCG